MYCASLPPEHGHLSMARVRSQQRDRLAKLARFTKLARFSGLTGASRISRAALMLSLLAVGYGCQQSPARYASPPPVPEVPLRYSLSELPFTEYWQGIRFNGQPAGYGHYQIQRSGQDYLIKSQAIFHLRLLGKDKQISTRSWDLVSADLQLKEFDYKHDLDGNKLQIRGHVRNSRLHAEILNSAGLHQQDLQIDSPLYSFSGSLLYPLLNGLAPGVRYRYWSYDGESQQLELIEQQITGIEYGPTFKGAAYRVESRIQENLLISWLSAESGIPLREEIGNGSITSQLIEGEQQALDYLAQAKENKSEALLAFSLVRTDQAIARPRAVTALEIELTGLGEFRLPEPDQRQQCHKLPAGEVVRCALSLPVEGKLPMQAPANPQPSLEPFLAHSPIIPSRHPELAQLSMQIIGDRRAPSERMQALVDWIEANIQDEAVDVFTALDVLKNGKAECQGQSFLYASLARAAGIPTRIVNGLVYSDAAPLHGFLYHTWAESWDGEQWHSIDPTFGQLPADATHIRLVDGETPADIAPLAQIMGQLNARILGVRTQ